MSKAKQQPKKQSKRPPYRTNIGGVQKNSQGVKNPFGRFRKSGAKTIKTITSDRGGVVQIPYSHPRQRMRERRPENSQMSLVGRRAYKDLQQGTKREVGQTPVMHISPNEAARALGLQPSSGWEWLHLVAFSIRQTHVDSLSTESMNLIKNTGQPQQIQENLVLGSNGANTAMLAYESFIKKIMRENPGWTLDLFVHADVERREVVKNNKRLVIPVATRIDYQFQFSRVIRVKNRNVTIVSPPVILAFNPMDHITPTIAEYGEITTRLEALMKEENFQRINDFEGLGTPTQYFTDVRSHQG